MYGDNGVSISSSQRRLIDRHEVCENVTVDECIIASGSIATDIRESTVEVLEDGKIAILPIDYQPGAPRA